MRSIMFQLGNYLLNRINQIILQTFQFLLLRFFFFRLFGFGRVIDGILEFVYLRLGFDRLGNQDREIHVFVSLNYDGSGVYI